MKLKILIHTGHCFVVNIFLSFPLNEEDEEMMSFYKHELERQKRILKTLTKEQFAMFDKHYKLLKFCDELSLYVCMNKPGVKKER